MSSSLDPFQPAVIATVCRTASDGAAALELLDQAERPVDLIISDWIMPL